MKPVEFPQVNKTYEKPAGWTDEQCSPLPTWTDGTQTISLWKMTWRERISALIFGRVWLFVVMEGAQPPVDLQAKRDVFTNPNPSRGIKSFPLFIYWFVFYQVLFFLTWIGVAVILLLWGFKYPVPPNPSHWLFAWVAVTLFDVVYLVFFYRNDAPKPKAPREGE